MAYVAAEVGEGRRNYLFSNFFAVENIFVQKTASNNAKLGD